MVETLSQANKELKAREGEAGKAVVLRIQGIKISTVEDKCEGSINGFILVYLKLVFDLNA